MCRGLGPTHPVMEDYSSSLLKDFQLEEGPPLTFQFTSNKDNVPELAAVF